MVPCCHRQYAPGAARSASLELRYNLTDPPPTVTSPDLQHARTGLARLGLAGPDGDPEDEIQRRRDHHPQQVRIYDAIRAPHECLGHQVTTDASIGVAIAPTDGACLDYC